MRGFLIRGTMLAPKKASMKDYYKILEVEPSATAEEIQAQHRILLHAWHPDKFPIGDLKVSSQKSGASE